MTAVTPVSGLTPLDIASSVVLGEDARVRLPDLDHGSTARAAFEAAVLEGLLQPPCVVSFSGGRDSSAVLAVASAVARRESLPPPIAVTLRFPTIPSAEESSWQERVIAHTGIQDWQKIGLEDADLLGGVAREQLALHGVLFPANAFLHAPLAARAVGGTLLTGAGGDEVMTGAHRWNRLNRVLTRQVRPRPVDLRDALIAGLPPVLRQLVLRRMDAHDPVGPWLRPEPAAAVRRQWAREVLAGPVRFDRMIAAHHASRYRRLGLQSLDRVARSQGAASVHPFGRPDFLAALATGYGRAGPKNRTQAMHDLFADVLPPDVIQRRGKATFGGAFWGPAVQKFVADWDGSGVDESLVDVDLLGSYWRDEGNDYRTYLMLHSAWLATSTKGGGR